MMWRRKFRHFHNGTPVWHQWLHLFCSKELAKRRLCLHSVPGDEQQKLQWTPQETKENNHRNGSPQTLRWKTISPSIRFQGSPVASPQNRDQSDPSPIVPITKRARAGFQTLDQQHQTGKKEMSKNDAYKRFYQHEAASDKVRSCYLRRTPIR